jgi:hypothetical protein
MTLKTLQQSIGSGLKPVDPASAFVPGSDVAIWRYLNGGMYVQEVFMRSSGGFGFRYLAWVAHRDAGGSVRAHLWQCLTGMDSLVMDTRDATISLAEGDIQARQALPHGDWQPCGSTESGEGREPVATKLQDFD